MNVTGTDFVVVPITDPDRARAFYGETLGLPFSVQYGSMPGFEYETGSLTLALLQMEAFGQEFRPNGGPIALQVDDVHAARTELEAAGVPFFGETMDSGVCHQAVFADPDGNPLILHHRYAPRS